MSKITKLQYKLSPEWMITREDNNLLITGGADAKYEIELESNEPSFFSSSRNSQLFIRDDLSLADQRLLEELVTAEIVVPVLQKNRKLNVAIVGDNNQITFGSQRTPQRADLVIVVRTNSTYAELLEKIKYQSLTKPHLFVDMAFHHTLSIGPLVFPGETACIACLQGRITTRWGDEKPPMAPRMARKYSSVASALIKTELDRIHNGDTSLTNKTCSWNFQERVVKKDQLLKVPLCPICTKNMIDHSGAIALPWGEDESITNTV